MAQYLDKVDPLWRALQAIVADERLELYDAERIGNGGLRLSVSAPEKIGRSPGRSPGRAEPEQSKQPAAQESGVTSGDCSRICRRLMTFFEVEGPNFGLSVEPHIEVSSPGVNRTLRLPEHFRGAIGERLKIVPSGKIELEGRQLDSLVGELKRFEDDELLLEEESSKAIVKIAAGDIKKAAVEFRF